MTATSPTLAVAQPEITLRTGRGRLLLGGFTAAHFSHHVSNSLLTPLLPVIRDTFALSYAQSGLLVSAFSLSLGLSNAPIGVLADKVGSRPVIVWGLILTGLISAAVSFSTEYWHLLALLVVMGLIAGSYHAPAAALLARAFPPRVRGTAMGFHITGGHLSFFAVPLSAAYLVGWTGTWATPYLWLAWAPILTGVMIWFLVPKQPEQQRGSTDRLAVFRELRTVLKTVGPLVSTSILFQMSYAAMLAFMTLYFVDVKGIDRLSAAALFGVPHLVGLVGAPMGGWLSDRLGRKTVIMIGMGLMGPSVWALTAIPNELIVLPLVLIGFAAAMRMTVTEVLVMDSAPDHRRATVMGSYHMLTQELGGFAAPVLGAVAGAIGIGAAFGGFALFLAAASAIVLVIGRRL
jgi:MFS family permease